MEAYKTLEKSYLLRVHGKIFLLSRDMVIDYHFLFDMMMTVMMHYNGDEDHFFLCHRHWDLDNLLHLALKDALLRDHLWPLHNFLLLMWDVKVHNHLLLDMVMTMVVHDRWNMHNLFLCHRDWHFNYMLALSMDNLFLLDDPIFQARTKTSSCPWLHTTEQMICSVVWSHGHEL